MLTDLWSSVSAQLFVGVMFRMEPCRLSIQIQIQNMSINTLSAHTTNSWTHFPPSERYITSGRPLSNIYDATLNLWFLLISYWVDLLALAVGIQPSTYGLVVIRPVVALRPDGIPDSGRLRKEQGRKHWRRENRHKGGKKHLKYITAMTITNMQNIRTQKDLQMHFSTFLNSCIRAINRNFICLYLQLSIDNLTRHRLDWRSRRVSTVVTDG